MSDRIPGTSYDNPIWYREYRIHLGPAYTPDCRWTYCHDDYDGIIFSDPIPVQKDDR